MKKSVMRVFTMLLTIAMLFSMCASAGTQKITFDLNGYDGTKLDGILSIGYDEDGCEQYSFENSVLGKFVLQSDGANLVFGSDQDGYRSVGVKELSEAITLVVSRLVTREHAKLLSGIINYVNSPALQMDAQVAGELLAVEVNRLAGIAQSLGLVVIYENGDLEIKADLDNVFAMISAYLMSLSEDADQLNKFANLEIFKAMGVSMTQRVSLFPGMLKEAAENMEEMLPEIKSQMDGGLELYVSADDGTVTGKYSVVTMVNGVVTESMTENFVFSENGSKSEAVTISNGEVTTVKTESDENHVNYSVNVEKDGQTANFGYKMDANGFVATAFADTMQIAGEGEIVIDANGINGEWDFSGEALVLNGNIHFDPATENMSFKLNMDDGTETLTAVIESANELHAEMEYTYDGETLSEFVITGTDEFSVKGNWTQGYGYPKYVIDAVIRMTDVGPEIVGMLRKNFNTYEFYYANDVLLGTEKVVYTITENRLKITSEAVTSVDGDNEHADIKITVNGYDGSTVIFNQTMDNNAVANIYSGTFEIDQDGVKNNGSYKFGADGFEVKFTDDDVIYRIYAENVMNDSDIALKAGFAGAELSDPDTFMDLISFVLNANVVNEFTFEAVLNSLLGVYAAASFDGEAVMIDVVTEDETVSFIGRMVETENGAYLEFTGFASEMPFEARIGLKMENANTICLFAEAFLNGENAFDAEAHLIQNGNEIIVEVLGDSIVIDGVKAVLRAGMKMETEETVTFYAEAIGDQPGYRVGASLPVTVVETADTTVVSAELSIYQGDEVMEIGDAKVIYEANAEGGEHVEGEPLSVYEMANMIMRVLRRAGIY